MAPAAAQAIELREATFTQVVNTVNVTNPQGNSTHPAQVNTKFATPEIIRTGASSRAELTAADQTVTRVGANTIFSFKPEGRGINLQQGSVLFNSPTGRGGGTIQTAAATASVLGTTIIVSTTRNGGFKLLVLEGHAKATLPNGRALDLKAGQMTFIVPGMTTMPQVFEFRLSKQSQGSDLVKGFKKPLPAQDKVDAAIILQNLKIAKGDKTDTGYLIGDVVNGNEVQVIDPNTLQAAQETQTAAMNSDAALVAAFQQAVSTDKTISAPTLSSSNVLYFPDQQSLRDAIASVGDPGANNSDIPNQLYGFGAKNLYIQSSSIDLSPYNDGSEFAFYATQSITLLTSSVNFGSFSGDISLRSLGTINIPSFSSLLFSTPGNAQLTANTPAGLTLFGVTLSNALGGVGIENMSGPITLTNGTMMASSFNGNGVDIEAVGNVNIFGTAFNVTGPSGSDGLFIGCGGNVLISGVNFTGTGLYVDIGSYNNNNSNTLGFTGGSVTLSGSSFTSDSFEAQAHGDIFSAGTNITASNHIGLKSEIGAVTFSNGTASAGNDIDFGAGTSVTVNTATLSSNQIQLHNGNLVTVTNSTLNSGGLIDLTSNNVTVNASTLSGDQIHINAAVGTINLINGNFTANTNINIATNANNGSATVSGTTFNTSSGATLSLLNGVSNSSAFLSVNNTTFSGNFGQIAMSAYTINLTNVSFAAGQTVFLTSGVAHGFANFGSSIPGWVNFIGGVSYGGTPVTSSASSAFFSNGGNIHIN